MKITSDGLILEESLSKKKKSNNIGSILMAVGIILSGVAYTFSYKSEEKLPQKWQEEIRDITACRQKGFYGSASAKAADLTKRIDDYETERESGENFGVVSSAQIKALRECLENALSVYNTNDIPVLRTY